MSNFLSVLTKPVAHSKSVPLQKCLLPINSPHNYLLEEAFHLSQTKSQPERLLEIREQLRLYSSRLQKQPLPIGRIPLTVRQCFAKAVLLLTRYPQLGSTEIFGTIDSPTLSTYGCDHFAATLGYGLDQFGQEVCQKLGLNPHYAEELGQLLQQVDEAIATHRRIMAALVEEVGGIATKESVSQLFQLLFGDLPLPQTAIDCLGTPMQLCFTVDYEDGKLRDKSLWGSLAAQEQVRLGQFLQQLDQFSLKQFACFPSFGKIQPKKINDELCKHLAQKTGCNQAQIRQAIQSAVGIFATAKAEAFFIHDIWGHFWQLFLTDFLPDYQALSGCSESLTPSFHSLKLVRTHLLAEMLADMNEFKWIAQHPQQGDLLPSSSLFKHDPTKLDLACRDLGGLLEPILQQQYQEDYPSIVVQLLGEVGKLQNILNRIYAQSSLFKNEPTKLDLTSKDLESLLEPILEKQYQEHYSSLLQPLLKELLDLQNTLNQAYTQPPIQDNFPQQDLLLLFTANYHSRDFYYLSEAIGKYFFSCCYLISEL